jgi:hypothetical protein
MVAEVVVLDFMVAEVGAPASQVGGLPEVAAALHSLAARASPQQLTYKMSTVRLDFLQ